MPSGNVLVIGRTGQVARALALLSPKSTLTYRFAGRAEADLTRPSSLKETIETAAPHLIINAAAYTAVDKAETESAEAYAVNAEGPRHLAAICAERDIPLLQISTDYVFDGRKNAPYLPDDATNPINVYGASKLAGEGAVRERLAKHLILRLAWVYSEGGRNFVTTMLRLAEKEPALRVVNDQIGQPTYAADIASALDKIATETLSRVGDAPWGTYHLTNSGQTSWFAFAEAIFEHAGHFGLRRPSITAIGTKDYPTPAPRPRYSVLDHTSTVQRFSVAMPAWHDALNRCLDAIFAEAPARKRGALT